MALSGTVFSVSYNLFLLRLRIDVELRLGWVISVVSSEYLESFSIMQRLKVQRYGAATAVPI